MVGFSYIETIWFLMVFQIYFSILTDTLFIGIFRLNLFQLLANVHCLVVQGRRGRSSTSCLSQHVDHLLVVRVRCLDISPQSESRLAAIRAGEFLTIQAPVDHGFSIRGHLQKVDVVDRCRTTLHR